MKYECTICHHIYDENVEGIKWVDLPEDWVCPLCGVSKDICLLKLKNKYGGIL